MRRKSKKRSKLSRHVRSAGAAVVVSGLLLAAALFVRVQLVTPAMLAESGATWSAVLGVVGASCWLALIVVVPAGGAIAWIETLGSRGLAWSNRAYRTVAFAVPLWAGVAAWVQFRMFEGRPGVASALTIAGGCIVGIVAAHGLARALPSDDGPGPGWIWTAIALLLLSPLFLERPEIRSPPSVSCYDLMEGAEKRLAGRTPVAPEGREAPAHAELTVLVTVDTLRADHMGAYGYARDTTPVLDRLARQGALVESMVAVTSCTVPSTASILTGLWPWCSGVTDQTATLPAGIVTLAERFRAAGYSTLAVVTNPLLRESGGFDQGFDEFHNSTRQAPYPTAGAATATALARIDALDLPLFVWVHYMDPHYPYLPPAESYVSFLADELYDPSILPIVRFGALGGVHRGNVFLHTIRDATIEAGTIVARYDGEIRTLDAGIGELVEGLRQRGLAERTAMAITADHGETLTGHEQYFQHCMDVYDSTIRVPAIFWRPGVLAGGTEIDTPASQIDVAPTLIALAGLPPDTTFQGIDLLAPDAGDAMADRPLFTQTGWWDGGARFMLGGSRLRQTRALVTGDWKYVSYPRHELAQVRGPISLTHAWRASLVGLWREDGLYDLAADPAEKINRIADHPARAERMRRELAAHPSHTDIEQCPFTLDRPKPPTDAEQAELEEKLKTLGYID